MQNIVILGSTGTIGRNTLEVVRRRNGEWRVMGIACRRNKSLLARQIQEFRPPFVYMEKPDNSFMSRFSEVKFFHGEKGIEELVSLGNIDLVMYAIPGISTLNAFIASVNRKQRIGLATKEILVVAGDIVMPLARRNGSVILPVDSEHNAVFQALEGLGPGELERIYLTASGGPFYGRSDTGNVTAEEVLAHPVWKMGEKITVDSATMLNKAFEMIEAHYLFSVPPEKIEVLIHPQAVIHGMAELSDGTIKGVFSYPDMKFPISHVMDYPGRKATRLRRLNFQKFSQLTLVPADRKAAWFALAVSAMRKKGSFPVVLNGANEAAVEMFLKGIIRFDGIIRTVECVLAEHEFKEKISVEDIFMIDRWAKSMAREAAMSGNV